MIGKMCKIKNCDWAHCAKGLCSKHYSQFKRHGKALKRTFRDLNEIIVYNNYCEIVLYSGRSEQKEVARTKIDKEDLEKIKYYKCGKDVHGYCVINFNKKQIKLHKFIFGEKSGYEIDHINNDPLDNRKINLRFATRHENSMNTRYKGYYWHKQNKKWCAEVMINYKKKFLGCFSKEEDAKKAAREGRIKYFGKFAYKKHE